MRLIDANEVLQRNEEAFKKAVTNPAENFVSVVQYHTVKEMVNSSPTVDAVEVVHGRFVDGAVGLVIVPIHHITTTAPTAVQIWMVMGCEPRCYALL